MATSAPAWAAGTWTISTVVGNGSEGNAIAGSAASFAFPSQLAVDSNGNILIADTYGQTVRVYAATSGTFYGRPMTGGDVYTVAGNGAAGFGGDDLPATASSIGYPEGVALDDNGNVVIGDNGDCIVQVVAATSGTFYGQAMTAGDIYAVAGDATCGYSGDGGAATAAELSGPAWVSVGPDGNLLIADQPNNVVRVVAESTGTFYGKAMTAGDIYTVAGDGTAGYSGDGGAATAAELDSPNSAVADSSGNLVISDNGNYRVRVVAGSTGTFYGQAMTKGNIYTVAGDGTAGYSGDGGAATAAELDSEFGSVSVDPSGNLVINDSNNFRVRVVAHSTGTFYGQPMTKGDIYTVAGDGTGGETGDGGPATSAELGYVDSATFDASGNMIIDDGNIRVVAKSTGTFYGQSMTKGDVYTVAGNGTDGYSGDGGAATAAELNGPYGVAIGPSDGIVVVDTQNDRVRMAAGATGTFYGQAMTEGDIYTVAGDGTYGYSGDKGKATKAELGAPTDAAVDANGNLVIADEENSRVRVVAAKKGTFYGKAMKAGDIYTIAGDGTYGYKGVGGAATSAEIGYPHGIAFDAYGNVIITDAGLERVLVVAEATGSFYGKSMKKGDIYLIAGDGKTGYSGDGNKATSAKLSDPNLANVDKSGNVLFADSGNNRIRVVAGMSGTFYGEAMTEGDIYTIAGDGTLGYSGDGGAATSAELNHPDGVAIDSLGNVVISDSHNNVIRVVAESTGTFYGEAMTEGDIYTAAGDGTSGYSGDGGTATSAELANPVGVATLSTGNSQGDDLYIAESGNSRVREVSFMPST